MIDYQQSEVFLIVLQNASGEVEVVLLPDGNHSKILSDAGARIMVGDFLARFFQQNSRCT